MSRLRCPELRRLPRSSKITAIQWRDQTPGALEPLFTLSQYHANLLVDPLHPGAALKKSQFPATLRDDVGIRMLPLGLLLREERQFPSIPILTWSERVQKAKEAGITGNRSGNMPNIRTSNFSAGEQLYPERDYNNEVLSSRNSTPLHHRFLDLKLRKTERRVPMSFHVATSKGRMGQSRHQRKRLETRLRAALNLIVTKGAFHDVKEGKIGIDMKDSGRKWVMQGWAYMFYPTTKINQMPYANLIDLLRQLLTTLNTKAIRMENAWLNKSLLAENAVRPRTVESAGSSNIGYQRIRNPLLKTSRPSTVFETRSQMISESPAALTSDTRREKNFHPEMRQVKSNPNIAEQADYLPMQYIAGKSPAQWQKELFSGLQSLINARSPDPKDDSSENKQ